MTGNEQTAPETSGWAIASLVCGVLGFFTAGLAGVIAIVLGCIGLSQIRKSDGAMYGRGYAIAGLILGSIPIVAIVGVVYGLRCEAESAIKRQAMADFKSFAIALEAYKYSARNYPTTEQGLNALVEKPVSDPVPIGWVQIMTRLPRDLWGNPFLYQFPGTKKPDKPEIISKGKDGIANTADDLSSEDE